MNYIYITFVPDEDPNWIICNREEMAWDAFVDIVGTSRLAEDGIGDDRVYNVKIHDTQYTGISEEELIRRVGEADAIFQVKYGFPKAVEPKPLREGEPIAIFYRVRTGTDVVYDYTRKSAAVRTFCARPYDGRGWTLHKVRVWPKLGE